MLKAPRARALCPGSARGPRSLSAVMWARSPRLMASPVTSDSWTTRSLHRAHLPALRPYKTSDSTGVSFPPALLATDSLCGDEIWRLQDPGREATIQGSSQSKVSEMQATSIRARLVQGDTLRGPPPLLRTRRDSAGLSSSDCRIRLRKRAAYTYAGTTAGRPYRSPCEALRRAPPFRRK